MNNDIYMTEKSQLNFNYQPSNNHANAQTMIFLHGLFGDLNNLGAIAKPFAERYSILMVDLRNHGRSFHSDEMNYALIAQDFSTITHRIKYPKCYCGWAFNGRKKCDGIGCICS